MKLMINVKNIKKKVIYVIVLIAIVIYVMNV